MPGYTSARGATPFRSALADFLSTHLTGCSVHPDHIGVSAGATSVIEMTAYLLADEGDVAVIPAPAYPVYRADLGNLSRVERYDLITHHHVTELRSGLPLSVKDLDRAKLEIEASGRRFRLLILTTPDNPTGGIYSEEQLRRVADWCERHDVHLIVNEIYGLSLIDTGHADLVEDYDDPAPFVSFARLMEERRSDRLHLWYALSKDLGISGLRVGVLHSYNEALLTGYENVNLTHSVSNHTQWLLSRLLADADFMTGYVERNQERLTASYASVVRRLRELGIPYAPSRGSLFAWIDLSEFLDEPTEAAELKLWAEIFRVSRVLLTPGVGFGHSKAGLFRVVYPCVSYEELGVAMDRVAAFVRAKRMVG